MEVYKEDAFEMKALLNDYIDNPEAQDLVRIINYTKDSVFLTGKAGTGKSTLLKNLIKQISKNYIILAPTGIAALNVEGQTIHSFFQFEPRPYLPFDKDLADLPKKQDLLEKLDLIIIDEISMVRCDLMNAIDLSLRRNLKSNIPFAGKQLLVIGDLFQLPPVVDNKKVEEVNILESNYKTPYFFSALVFEKGFKYHIIELEKVYRQKDKDFIDLLNGVRENMIKSHHLSHLNQRYNSAYAPDGKEFEIILATTNEIVRQTNYKEIQKLIGKLYEFNAVATGVFLRERSESKLPADRILQVKEGAQVMFVKNDQEKRWVNGSIGKIISIVDNSLKVKLDINGQVYDVQKVTWENYEYVWNKEDGRVEKDINGEFTQFPLKLAWAVTIHKSQGQSFDKIVIDLGSGAFAAGQTYVTLSRCRSFTGITLKSRVNSRDIKTDERVKQFLNSKNKKEMERERFENIVECMQAKLDLLEPINAGLSSRILKLESDIRQEQQKLAIVNSSLQGKDGLIRSKESIISTLSQEKDNLKKEVDGLKNGKSKYRFFLLILFSICIILVLKLIAII